MQADTGPGNSNLVKFTREFETLYQDVDQPIAWDRVMEFYATTFDNVHDVMGRNDCTEDMSACLAGIETYLVTDCMIGDAVRRHCEREQMVTPPKTSYPFGLQTIRGRLH
ncbi:MAG TPA: hypothetical protein VFB98_08290 [Candidatus Deferrimicrobium sp.]|nr:hypothetical protein [Candidatus Deferrimicrobium sp.]